MEAERKAAFTPVDDPPVTDGDLDKAAAAAVAKDEPEKDPGIKPEEDLEKDPEKDGNGLPVEHKARSDLGRKFSALHRRQDGFDAKLDKLLDVLAKQPAVEDDDPFSDTETLTKAEAKQYFEKLQKEANEQTAKQKQIYQADYDDTLVTLSSDYTDDEANAIFSELQTMRYNPTKDGRRDAELNILKAERAYLRKKTAGKKKDVPLKQDPVTGVMTSQKAPQKDVPDVKLSAAGESYLNFIARKDGDERAQQIKKSL